MNKHQLLAEVEDLLRTSPSLADFSRPKNDLIIEWLGRTAAVLHEWDFIQSAEVGLHIGFLQGDPEHLMPGITGSSYRGIRTLLYQAQHNLRMNTIGPLSVAISDGKPFEYFEEVRRIISMASDDLLFIDPYLDAEFVSIYLPQIREGVTVRLLTSKKIQSLIPAVRRFSEQTDLEVQVRSSSSRIHDRYVFVDMTRCYHSGASFKDGAKQSPTTLTEITDAFQSMYETYQRKWNEGEIKSLYTDLPRTDKYN